MLPASTGARPCRSRTETRSPATVDLPLVPVTASTGEGTRRQPRSSSSTICRPRRAASARTATSGAIPGLLTIDRTSARASRPSPPNWTSTPASRRTRARYELGGVARRVPRPDLGWVGAGGGARAAAVPARPRPTTRSGRRGKRRPGAGRELGRHRRSAEARPRMEPAAGDDDRGAGDLDPLDSLRAAVGAGVEDRGAGRAPHPGGSRSPRRTPPARAGRGGRPAAPPPTHPRVLGDAVGRPGSPRLPTRPRA